MVASVPGATVVAVQRTTLRGRPPERLSGAAILADWGVEGDRHARPGSSRQVVLTEVEVLARLGLPAGATREQLTLGGMDPLSAGDVLEIGRVRLELVRPRVPCPVMDTVRPGLERELRGQGGWCARVLSGGVVRPGDEVGRSRVDDPGWLSGYRAALAAWEAAPHRPVEPGRWSFTECLAHLVAWDERGATRIAAAAAGRAEDAALDDIDRFNAAAVARLVVGGRPEPALWILHDTWSTAVVDAVRRHPDPAEEWVRSLAAHYREHT